MTPKPILVGYDPRSLDRAPVDFAAAAARFTGSPLIVASAHADAVQIHELASPGQIDAELAVDAHAALDDLGRELRDDGVAADCRPFLSWSTPQALHDAAEQLEAGLLVVGSSRRAQHGRLHRGSTAERLLHGAPCPVAIVPRGWEPGGGIRTIGAAYVATPEGRDALRGAVALARRAGADVRVLSAARPHGYAQTQGGGPGVEATTFEEIGSELRVHAEEAIQAEAGDVRDVRLEPDVSVQDPGDFLVAASRHLDLLVCGSRGYGPTRAVLLGGVSRRLTAEAHCPVVVLVRGTEAGLERLLGERAGSAV